MKETIKFLSFLIVAFRTVCGYAQFFLTSLDGSEDGQVYIKFAENGSTIYER